MSEPQVGAELIIFGERTQTDLSGVLADVAAAGYGGFEGAAPASSDDLSRLRAALEGKALSYAGGHCGEKQWMDPETVTVIADSVKALGGRFVLASGGYSWKTLDEYRKGAAALNEAGGRCREAGLTFCYHNHAWEFSEIEGTKPIHFLMEQTDPDLVKLCPDVYWIHVGGEPPADFIARYRARCPYFHFKDGLAGDQFREFRELGRGRVDLRAALRAALACQPEWIVTEQDSAKGDPAESIRVSREYLRSLGL